MRTKNWNVIFAACSLLLAGALLLPGTSSAATRRVPMSEFKESTTFTGGSILVSATPGQVVGTPGVDPGNEVWGGHAPVSLAPGKLMISAFYFTGGYLEGRTSHAALFRVRFGGVPERLASASFTVPASPVEAQRVSLTWDTGADKVVRAGYTYYFSMSIDAGTNVNGAAVRFQ